MSDLEGKILYKGNIEDTLATTLKEDFCVIPQDMLDNIAQHGPKEAKEELMDMLHDISRQANMVQIQKWDKRTLLLAEQHEKYLQGYKIMNKTGTVVRKKPKTNRNSKCSCGSGSKYRKCCGKKDINDS